MRTTRFWDNLYQVHSKSKDWKAKEFKALGAIKPKWRNQDSQKSAKPGHLCLKKENLSFINNYIIKELYISVINTCNKPCQCHKHHDKLTSHCLRQPMLTVSLDCPFPIVPSVFSYSFIEFSTKTYSAFT